MESGSTLNDEGTLWETSEDLETLCFVHKETYGGYGGVNLLVLEEKNPRHST